MATTCEGNPLCEDWYLDSGCFNYMTVHKERFINFNSSKKTNVILTHNMNLAAEGIGDIAIKRKDERRH